MYKFAGVAVSIFILFCSCQTTNERVIAYADLDPIPAGTFKAAVLKPFAFNIKQIEIPLTFDPRTGSVYFDFFYDLVTYREYWSVENRAAFIAALARYKADYEAKNLNLSRNKSRRAYGTVKGSIAWGVLRQMLNNRGYPNFDLGYAFRNDSPYFTIYQREAPNVHASGDNVNSSISLTLYFTRAMADDLAALLSEEYLRSLLPSSVQPSAYTEGGEVPVDKDEVIPDAY
jgi:hypothetical protein